MSEVGASNREVRSSPIAAKLRTSREVRFVPIPEVVALFDHLVGDGKHTLGWWG